MFALVVLGRKAGLSAGAAGSSVSVSGAACPDRAFGNDFLTSILGVDAHWQRPERTDVRHWTAAASAVPEITVRTVRCCLSEPVVSALAEA